MKKFLAAILLALSFVSVAFADRADEIKKYDPESYCRYIATLFGAGVLNHNSAHPLEFKHWTPDENGRCPEDSGKTDGIYVCAWDSFTDNERAFVSEHVTNGYLFASKLGAHGAARPDPQEAAEGYHVGCMIAKTTEYGEQRKNGIKETAGPKFTRTAYPGNSQEQMCEFQRRVAKWIMVVNVGMNEEEFWERHPLPNGWREEVNDAAREIVRAAFAWQGTNEEFVKSILAACKK